jgi:hypothetical protein
MEAAMATTAVNDWRDLAQRTGGGLEVTLLWSKCRNQLKVMVIDHNTGGEFEFGASPTEALSAYYHPFIFADGPSAVTRARANTLPS